jgi:hypothetical protein
LSPVRVVDGRPLRCSSWTRVLPSENMCQRKACDLDIPWSPKACLSFPCIVAFSPSLTHTQDGIPLRFIPRFHFHKVHKHVLTRQAPTPHWGTAKTCHCK